MRLPTAEDWFATRPWIDRPDADIDAHVERAEGVNKEVLRAKLYEWRENGVVIFEGAASPELVDAYVNDFAYLRNHPQEFSLIVNEDGKPGDLSVASYTPERLHQPGMRFVHMHGVSKAAMLLSLCPDVALFLHHVFGAPPCVLQSLTFYCGSQQDIHIDYAYVFTQTRIGLLAASWIALEDVHPESGPLLYYPGSHRVESTGFFDWGEGSIVYNGGVKTGKDFSSYLTGQMVVNNITPVTFCPRKGDVLVWHGALAHAGAKVKAPGRTRQSYVTHYTSLDARPTWTSAASCQTYSANGGLIFLPNSGTGTDRCLPSWQSGRAGV